MYSEFPVLNLIHPIRTVLFDKYVNARDGVLFRGQQKDVILVCCYAVLYVVNETHF